jgi:hypothetical protein
VQFSSHQFDELRECLAQRPIPRRFKLHQVEQILLDSELRTRDGYTFTHTALKQFSQRMASGLWTLLNNLTRNHVATHKRDAVPTIAVSRIFNEVARHRFSAFRHRYAMLNERSIIGHCGPGMQNRRHSDFLDLCQPLLIDWQFVGADVDAVAMTLYYACDSIEIETPRGRSETYQAGVSIETRESHNGFVRIRDAVFHDGLYATGPGPLFLPRGTPLRWRNPAFVTDAIRNRLAEARVAASKLPKAFGRVLQDRLFATVDTPKKYEIRVARLQRLLRQRMTKPVAEIVIARALAIAESGSPYHVNLACNSPTLWPLVCDRRWYDLFEALLYIQRHPSVTNELRRATACAAYALLSGTRRIILRESKDYLQK